MEHRQSCSDMLQPHPFANGSIFLPFGSDGASRQSAMQAIWSGEMNPHREWRKAISDETWGLPWRALQHYTVMLMTSAYPSALYTEHYPQGF
ncbi:hypothetical protein CDEST_07445 [Colletotrichum destructivum]|uniref:Uncharacterized protein n=1 Tax=Colletotrichum destructivum TaxID=34406 RepID=A0AAX4IGE1_9PEZI|nr:hypothetical protein CDEST_07445 [Colletotrichum destructivum]